MIAGLKLARSLGATRVKVFINSQLVVNQIRGEYATKNMKMFAYLVKVKKLQFEFKKFTIEQLPKQKNSDVDALVNHGSSISSKCRMTIPVEILNHPSIVDTKDICCTEKTDGTWMDPIISYI